MELEYEGRKVTPIRPATLAWVDIETTGLSPQTDVILEIGMVLTDNHLNIVAEKSFVINPGVETSVLYDQSNAFVRELHTRNCLWSSLAGGVSLAYAEAELIAFMREHGLGTPEVGQTATPMAGSSVHFDRGFIEGSMPLLGGEFHYRNLDVSTIKELLNRIAPHVTESRPTANGEHRALPDLHDSITELRHYVVAMKEGISR